VLVAVLPVPPVFDNSTEIVVEIHFGEGGEDSKQFVTDLFSAYLKWAGSHQLKSELLDTDHGHVVCKITGKGCWKAFKNEPGKHCVQRYPKTERGGRRHTSMISVAVLPIPPERELKPLPHHELLVTAEMCRLHSGGQNAQKNATAIRAKHLPTGIVVFIQNERSQKQNREEALHILTAKVNALRQANELQSYGNMRQAQLGGGGRGNKIRTYNYIDSRITDHNLNVKTSRVEEVMRGRFDYLFKA
jgi:peptide chain release factor 1